MNYDAKQPNTLARQYKVQTLCIPLLLTASATAANVTVTSDEPSLLFFQTEGVNNITAALATSETATFSQSPSDANGVMNILVAVGEPIEKIMCAQLTARTSALETFQAVQLGSTTGITTGTGGGQKLMLTTDSTVSFAATNLDACLEVSYVVAE